MPKIVKFELKQEDYDYLRAFVSKGKASAREIKRAEILLFQHNQLTALEIEKIFGPSQSTVRRIRDRYLKDGVKSAISDQTRSGRPKKFTPEQRAKITALACSETPEGYGTWSLSLLAEQTVKLEFVDSISKAQIGRILKKTK